MEIKQITGVDLPLQPGILMLEETPEDIDTKNLSYLLGVFADRKEDDNSAIMFWTGIRYSRLYNKLQKLKI